MSASLRGGFKAAAFFALAIAGCTADTGERRISSSVIGSIACCAQPDDWYEALVYKRQFGSYPSEGADAAVMVMPGDRVQVLEQRNVDDQPALVDVTGEVDKIKTLDGIQPGTTCWLYSGSNPNGPLYE